MPEQVVENAGARPWDILPDEPSEWFVRFEKYRLMLPEDRSLKALYETERARRRRLGTLAMLPPYPTWKKMGKQYNWVARAREYDKVAIEKRRDTAELVRDEESRSAEEERSIQRQQRRQILNILFKKVLAGINYQEFDLTKVKPAELLAFTRVYLQQNREEFDNTPGKVAKFQYNTLSDQELYDLIKERIAALSEPA